MSSRMRFPSWLLRPLGALAQAEAAAAVRATEPLRISQTTNSGGLGPLTTITFNFTLAPLNTNTFVQVDGSFFGTTVGNPNAQVTASLMKGATVLRAIAVNAGASNGENFFGAFSFIDETPATGGSVYTVQLLSPSPMTVTAGGMWGIGKELSPVYTL